jgi:putative protease
MGDLAGAVISMVREAVTIGRPGTEIVWKWPAIASQAFEDVAAAGAGEVFESGVHAVLLNGTGPVSSLSAMAPGLPLYGGTGLNVFNHLTAIRLCPPFAQVTLSPDRRSVSKTCPSCARTGMARAGSDRPGASRS